MCLTCRKSKGTKSSRPSDKRRSSTSQGNNTTIVAPPGGGGDAPEADDMQDIMSQYLPQNNTDFTAGDGSTLIRAMDEAMGKQATPKAAAPAPNTAGTAATPGSAGGQQLNKTPQSAPTVPVDEDETQDPSAGMEGQFRVTFLTLMYNSDTTSTGLGQISCQSTDTAAFVM